VNATSRICPLTATILFGLLLSAPASALSADTDSTITLHSEWPGAARADRPRPGTAVAISVCTTLIPIAVGAFLPGDERAVAVASGVFVGPVPGYFYGGVSGRGCLGLLLRVGVATAGLAAAAATMQDSYDFALSPTGALALAAAGLFVCGDALFDAGVVGEHVARRNARLGSVEPTMRVASDGTLMAGMTLRPSF